MNHRNLSAARICAALAGLTAAAALPTTASAQQECTIGEIRYFAGNFAPRNWAFAQGQILPISTNTALFSILGVTYGGDGRSTFALPNFSGRTPVGTGRGPGLNPVQLGQLFGADSQRLNGVAGVPSHGHGASTSVAVHASSAAGSQGGSSDNAVLASPGDSDRVYTDASPNVDLKAGSMQAETLVQSAGSNSTASFENRQPSLGMNPIICLVGLYPSRS